MKGSDGVQPKDSAEIHFYNSGRGDLYITEFGHSLCKTPREVGPWIRDVYLLQRPNECVYDYFVKAEPANESPGEAFNSSSRKLVKTKIFSLADDITEPMLLIGSVPPNSAKASGNLEPGMLRSAEKVAEKIT